MLGFTSRNFSKALVPLFLVPMIMACGRRRVLTFESDGNSIEGPDRQPMAFRDLSGIPIPSSDDVCDWNRSKEDMNKNTMRANSRHFLESHSV